MYNMNRFKVFVPLTFLCAAFLVIPSNTCAAGLGTFSGAWSYSFEDGQDELSICFVIDNKLEKSKQLEVFINSKKYVMDFDYKYGFPSLYPYLTFYKEGEENNSYLVHSIHVIPGLLQDEEMIFVGFYERSLLIDEVTDEMRTKRYQLTLRKKSDCTFNGIRLD